MRIGNFLLKSSRITSYNVCYTKLLRFINLLALLGWNPGTEQEFFSLEELGELFGLERVVKSGSRFDPEKAKWFNKHYFQQKSVAELSELFKPVLAGKNIEASDEKIQAVVAEIKSYNFV